MTGTTYRHHHQQRRNNFALAIIWGWNAIHDSYWPVRFKLLLLSHPRSCPTPSLNFLLSRADGWRHTASHIYQAGRQCGASCSLPTGRRVEGKSWKSSPSLKLEILDHSPENPSPSSATSTTLDLTLGLQLIWRSFFPGLSRKSRFSYLFIRHDWRKQTPRIGARIDRLLIPRRGRLTFLIFVRHTHTGKNVKLLGFCVGCLRWIWRDVVRRGGGEVGTRFRSSRVSGPTNSHLLVAVDSAGRHAKALGRRGPSPEWEDALPPQFLYSAPATRSSSRHCSRAMPSPALVETRRSRKKWRGGGVEIFVVFF